MKSKYSLSKNSIEFTQYCFTHSSLHKSPIVDIDRISAINLNTFPHSLIIDLKEIVFVNHADENFLPEFADKNKTISIVEKDVWSLILNPFLDTEIEPFTIEQDEKQFLNYGFSMVEIKAIRKKVKSYFFMTMEWEYFGLWDLLARRKNELIYPLFGNKFYWWAMEVALQKRFADI